MVDRISRKGALVSYEKAVRHLVRRAIPADPMHPSVVLIVELYEIDEATITQDMQAMLVSRHTDH